VTIQGVLVVVLIAVAYLLWMVNLVRRGRLYVGYAVIWFGLAAITIPIVAIPGLLLFVTDLFGALIPVSALTFLAFAFLFGMQIYLLSQMTIMSRRIAQIAQYIAIKENEDAEVKPQLAQPAQDGQA
jgi:hypothetical protein